MSGSTVPRWGSNITAGLTGAYAPPVPTPGPAAEPTTPPPEAPHEPDPSLFQMEQYTRYDADGRVHSHGIMGLGILQQLRITEGRILIGVEADPDTQWIDNEDGNPTVEARPALDVPAQLAAAPGVEAVIPSLPACQIDFTGPLVGSHDHPGGEVRIGFDIPGTYLMTVEPFPYRRTTITLEVTT